MAAIRSNRRWCSDALEFTCWISEIVRPRPGMPLSTAAITRARKSSE
jgi:hypothetical protein